MKLRILSVAELDAADAALYYEEQKAGLGSDFLAELEHAIKRIRRNPAYFQRLETYAGTSDVRRCLLHRFPYLVVFLNEPDELTIVAVCDARRHPSSWLDRLKQ